MMMLKECPTCGRVSDGEDRTVCAGAQFDNSIHEPTNMVALRVFREEDVRPLYEAARALCDRKFHYADPPKMRAHDAIDAFPAPEGWR